MRDAPPVTLHDPGEPAGRDVLVGAPEREPRLSRRTRVLGGAGATLLAAGVVGGTSYAQHRAEQRERAAAFALADQVHVEGVVAAVFGFEPGSGRLGADVTLRSLAGHPGPHTVPTVRIEGAGLVPLTTGGPGRFMPPTQAVPESRVDCGAVAAGRIPASAQVVVTAVPASQVPHEQHLPVDVPSLREAVLAACDLPDPSAEPYVEASAQGDALVVLLETVRRSDAVLRLEEIRVPGFALSTGGRFSLPRVIEPDSGGVYGFGVRVTDCAAARAGDRAVTVVLGQGGRREERVAPHAVRQPQPGAVPVEQLLQRLVEAAC